MKIESFDQARRGRCPGCSMFDDGKHIGHRYGNDIYWSCGIHGDAFGKKPNWQAKDQSICAPDLSCKVCLSGLKRVAKFHRYLQRELEAA